MILQAVLLGLIGALGKFDYQLGTLYGFRPIVLAPLVGLVLGDLQQGLIIGASLEMIFLGAIAVGAYVPPDVITAGVLATAFAINSGKGVEAAVSLAMPIALIVLSVKNFFRAINPVILKFADDGATEGNVRKIKIVHWVMGLFEVIQYFLIIFFAYWLGNDAVINLLEKIPQVIVDGMGVAAGILPTMGFAMLMRMTVNKKNLPFYFLGVILTAYLDIPILGVAILGVIIVIEKFGFLGGKKENKQLQTEQGEINDDEEF